MTAQRAGESYEYFEARIRADWQDWTFGAHQATARAAAAEEVIALRRQFTDLSERDLMRLADSWRPDDASGPYFVFLAASGPGAEGQESDAGAEAAVSAAFVRELLRQLGERAPDALAALLDQWAEQRRYAAHAGMRPIPVRPPRVGVLLPRDPSQWPPESWDSLQAIELGEPRFDGTFLRWDGESGAWSPASTG